VRSDASIISFYKSQAGAFTPASCSKGRIFAYGAAESKSSESDAKLNGHF
jgi:hypothetical protein